MANQAEIADQVHMTGSGFHSYGNTNAKIIFVQLMDEHDNDLVRSEANILTTLVGNTDWCITAVPVSDWNRDLTPWPSPPVFGKQGFDDGAPKTLEKLLSQAIPAMEHENPSVRREYILCGYSLAGLFSLWAAYQTDVFSGVVAASPSVWYPDWLRYAENHQIRANHIYLSMGDKEERTRNPVMSTVGRDIQELHGMLTEAGLSCTLEWNPGNHFIDSDLRMAKGMAWMLEVIKQRENKG